MRPRDRWRLVGRSALPPFPHGSACVRRDVFERVGGYREGTHRWEDVDLFLRLEREGPVLVLPEALYRYRYHAGSLYGSAGDGHDDGAALMWRCIEAHRDGADWSALLGTADAGDPRRQAARWSARHAHGMQLWTGAEVASYAPAPTALLRARRAWQRRSPATLRAARRAAIRLRDLAATPLVPRDGPVRWRPT